jgi:hypothetical protein
MASIQFAELIGSDRAVVPGRGKCRRHRLTSPIPRNGVFRVNGKHSVR